MKTARVRALVEAARTVVHRVLGRDTQLADALVKATGLSPEGVALALREHLEVSPTDDEIEELVRAAGDAPAVHVILSANVFTAALRALALAVAAAPTVSVRCSSRESVFVPALIDAIEDSSKLGIQLVDSITALPGDELHLYGNDETLGTICAELDDAIRVRAHGTGIGIALISSDADLPQAAALLGRDIVPFDQRGCLSPRVAIVPDIERARELAERLREELEAWQSRVPAGRTDESLRSEIAAFRQAAEAMGEFTPCGAGGIAVAEELRAPWFAPTGRNLLVTVFEDEAAARWIAPIARHVASIGIAGSEVEWGKVTAACAGARRSALGFMQRPRFDGPVDRRTRVEKPSEVVRRTRN